jgi:hypothetical protein
MHPDRIVIYAKTPVDNTDEHFIPHVKIRDQLRAAAMKCIYSEKNDEANAP